LVYTIEKGEQECLYESLHPEEHVTISVFIRSGKELRGHAKLVGPVASDHVKTGPDLFRAIQDFESGRGSTATISQDHFVDYEDLPHLHKYEDLHVDSDSQDNDDGVPVDDMYYYYDMEEHGEPHFIGEYDDDSLTAEERQHLKETDEEMYQERMHHWREVKSKRDLIKSQKKAHKTLTATRKRRAEVMEMVEGGPFQHTVMVEDPGWYRLCVGNKHHKITAEIEMRKESEVGHPNRNTGHLMTYERFEMLKEERKVAREHRMLEKKFTKENPVGTDSLVQPQDVERINDKLKHIHRVLQDIQEQQALEEHRLAYSTAVNEHTHSRMVVHSLIETCLYIAVSAYQVYTIRRWFSGGPMLGF